MGEPTSPVLVDSVESGFRVLESPGTRWLESADGAVQSRMTLSRPSALALAYTRVMALALLFAPAPRDALLLGLGGGSFVRFLRKFWPDTRIDVVEADAEVVRFARAHFDIPPDDSRLAIHHMDARDAPRYFAGRGFDFLVIDLFGHGGLPEWLTGPGYYASIRARLTPGGVLAANVWVKGDEDFLATVGGIRRAFDGRVLVSDVEGFLNLVAYAFGPAPGSLSVATLQARARRFEKRHALPYTALLRRLAELNPVADGAFVL